jgi:endogenous inhibitor of DNA gyrase (YacG/DUF329 family)
VVYTEIMEPQIFTVDCPHCGGKLNAAEVVKRIPPQVFAAEVASRNGRRQTRHAGPGRPSVVRCPGCDSQMSTAELKEHRPACVRARLGAVRSTNAEVFLLPKDPDPYPAFSIKRIDEETNTVEFLKNSAMQYLSIELQKIAEITPAPLERAVYIRLLGRVAWDASIERWRFLPRSLLTQK